MVAQPYPVLRVTTGSTKVLQLVKTIALVKLDSDTLMEQRNQSSLLTRGFKPGYSISETSGLAIADGGNGGNGATGGAGGVSGDGGGGGSGYTDDTFDIINAELGGNTTASSTVTFQVVT